MVGGRGVVFREGWAPATGVQRYACGRSKNIFFG
jgi:hypothetical protein